MSGKPAKIGEMEKGHGNIRDFVKSWGHGKLYWLIAPRGSVVFSSLFELSFLSLTQHKISHSRDVLSLPITWLGTEETKRNTIKGNIHQ